MSKHSEESDSSIAPTNLGFATLDLRPELLESLTDLGYSDPTPIQFETIPLLLQGSDVLGQAATGTGKTAAFSLPIINGIESGKPGAPIALVVVPTRELAIQVSEAITGYGRRQSVKVLAVYGGSPIQDQIRGLRRGVHVVVATPGRAIDLIKRKVLILDEIATVVLDEADEILDMGFAEDIETILESTPSSRQTLLFSATMPPRIRSIAARHQRDPVRIEVGLGKDAPSNDLVRQTVYMVQRKHKPAALGRIIDIEAPTSALVFCKTRNDVDELAETMNVRGYRAEALHGGMDQSQRDRVMGRLRDGTANLLVATDVAARGLDVDTLSHVVNYDVPSQPESYVHRIGRVGRAGREGVAITLAEPRNRRLLSDIERLLGRKLDVAKVPSIEQLRERQLELTVAAVSDTLGSEDIDEYNNIIHELTSVADLRDIALAAIKLVHEARNSSIDETYIPEIAESKSSRERGRDRGGNKGRSRYEKSGPKSGRGNSGHRAAGGDNTGFVYVGVGRKGNIRPGDLVGAIANEVGIPGRDIGPIKISDHFSVVGVPNESVEEVVEAINGSSIRGKKAKARRYVQ
ncbi:MAG: DEAD/DEAH box helicase [Actinobacteria bacterium]|nr:DEAD/DEAH box helicase [Actinomycetota bacterium]